MANKLDNVKLVSLDLLTGTYTTNLKTWVENKIGAEGLRTVSVNQTTHKMNFYKEASDVVTADTAPAFSIDYAKVAGTGAASDVSLTTISGLTSTDVQSAIAELLAAINAIDYSGKADKVASATDGNFAGLDADGNLTDSGKKASDFDAAGAAAAVSGYGDGETAKTVKEVAESLGTAAAKDAKTGTIADADGEDATADNNLVSASQVVKYVKDKTSAIMGATHFRGVVTATSDITDPASGDIVVIQSTSKEYIYDGSAWVELGDESSFVSKTTTIAGVDLQNDITKEELQTALNVADGADVSLVQGVQVNGVDVTPDGDKKVNIAIAEGTTNGSVAVNGTDVPVHGLGSAAYTESSDYLVGPSPVIGTNFLQATCTSKTCKYKFVAYDDVIDQIKADSGIGGL